MLKRIILGQLRHLIVTGPLAALLISWGLSVDELETVAGFVAILFSHTWSALDKVKEEKQRKKEIAAVEKNTKDFVLQKLKERGTDYETIHDDVMRSTIGRM